MEKKMTWSSLRKDQNNAHDNQSTTFKHTRVTTVQTPKSTCMDKNKSLNTC
ncbi:unnamed protein product [Brassica oleracea]